MSAAHLANAWARMHYVLGKSLAGLATWAFVGALEVLSGCWTDHAVANGYVFTECSGGTYGKLPCSIDTAHVGNGYYDYRFGRLLPPYHPDVRFGAYRGLSGAPVYTLDGTFVGINALLLTGSNTSAFGILEAHELDTLWARARALGQCPTIPGECMPMSSDIVPGSNVSALLVWGDCRWGVSGKIGAREGNEVLMFGHAIVNEHQGPTVFALARAPILGIGIEHGEANELTGLDTVIGCVTYNSGLGAYGVLGVEVPSMSVNVLIARRADGYSHKSCSRVARHPTLTMFGVAQVVMQTMATLDMIARDGIAQIQVQGLSTKGELTVEVESKDQIAQEVLRTVQSIFSPAGGARDCTDLVISIIVEPRT